MQYHHHPHGVSGSLEQELSVVLFGSALSKGCG
jgi:hypothetical protein